MKCKKCLPPQKKILLIYLNMNQERIPEILRLIEELTKLPGRKL